jgi:hypothetical protein
MRRNTLLCMSTITVRLDAETESQLTALRAYYAQRDELGRIPTTTDIVRRAIARMHAEVLKP